MAIDRLFRRSGWFRVSVVMPFSVRTRTGLSCAADIIQNSLMAIISVLQQLAACRTDFGRIQIVAICGYYRVFAGNPDRYDECLKQASQIGRASCRERVE